MKAQVESEEAQEESNKLQFLLTTNGIVIQCAGVKDAARLVNKVDQVTAGSF